MTKTNNVTPRFWFRVGRVCERVRVPKILPNQIFVLSSKAMTIQLDYLLPLRQTDKELQQTSKTRFNFYLYTLISFLFGIPNLPKFTYQHASFLPISSYLLCPFIPCFFPSFRKFSFLHLFSCLHFRFFHFFCMLACFYIPVTTVLF